MSQSNSSIEIVHGFGQQDFNVSACVDAIKSARVRRLLVFYSLEHAHAVEDLQTILSEQADVLLLVGEIPEQRSSFSGEKARRCCASSDKIQQSSCCQNGTQQSNTSCTTHGEATIPTERDASEKHEGVGEKELLESEVISIGGLSFDRHALGMYLDGDYSVLYVGSETNFQFMTIAMRLASQPPQSWYTNDDSTGEVQPFVSKKASQLIKTRFYLIQKAKLCHVFGILVVDVNRDEASIQGTIQSLQKLLHEENRVSYTFVVGSLNPAKLANFGEIDCFIWLACPEHSILQHSSTDYHVPVVTLYELLVAFDRVPWGTYETQVCIDPMLRREDNIPDNPDNDAPFFSLVTGTYQPQRQEGEENHRLELKDDPLSPQSLPGKGILSKYTSVAADRLKCREYKGLVVDKDAPVAPAIPGRTGIASSYQSNEKSSLERL